VAVSSLHDSAHCCGLVGARHQVSLNGRRREIRLVHIRMIPGEISTAVPAPDVDLVIAPGIMGHPAGVAS
jgi:hypothetical protein